MHFFAYQAFTCYLAAPGQFRATLKGKLLLTHLRLARREQVTIQQGRVPTPG